MSPEPPVSILLVDDRPDKLMALESVLAPLGENLVLAHSGKEALRCLLQRDFAVILLDVNMPIMDGFETATLIRQRRSSETTPIIFVSAINDTETHLSRGYSLGAVDYILAPVVPEILRAKVSVFVDLFKKTEQVKRQADERAEFIREQAARAEAEAGQERFAKLYEEARAAREAAESANAAKDKFLAMLSHELRTPLTPVLNTVQIMQGDADLTPEFAAALEMIRRNIELEARLIDDLLDLTRISKGKVQLRPETVDVHRLLENTLEICRDEISDKQLCVEAKLRADAHHLRADSARLQQVFWNLLKNAVKFTPAGGRITLRTDNPGPGRWRARITDTGSGIPADALPKIFDAFEQGEFPREGGLGLGLAITKAIVDLHEGEITAASAGPGQGATLTVEFATVAWPGATAAKPATTVPADGRPGAAGAPRVLLVDDHVDTLRSMQVLLRQRGYAVRVAGSVRSGMEMAAEGDFDVLISDVGLPDGSGLDLMRQLRSARGGAEIIGIALSGYGMEEDVARSREAGFGEHLTKPVDVGTLDAAVRRLTARVG